MAVQDGIYIALGSNLGDRAAHIRTALAELEEDGDIRVLRCSKLYETEPVGGPPGQGLFLNAVAELETDLTPGDVFSRMQSIEARHGRQRGEKNAPRTLDMDLLLYGGARIDEPDLTIPHPRMWTRPFVLEPLAEICPHERLAHLRAQTARPGEDC